MKRILAMTLVLVLVLSLGAVSVSAAPEASMEETVLVDNDDLAVTVTDYDPAGDWGPTFELLLENKTDRELRYRLEQVVVNGVMCDPFWSEGVSGGKKSYSDLYWYEEDFQAAGINYIMNVTGTLDVYDGETYDDVFQTEVAWEVTVGETDMPAVEPVTFDHGFAEQEILTGDVVFTVKDYDPTGSYDEAPQLVFYMENHTDRSVYFEIDDVSVNGFECDPYWGMTVSPGAVAYDTCEWWKDDLEESHIDTVETIEFTASAEGDEDYEEIASADVTLDLTGAAPVSGEDVSIDEPAAADGGDETKAAGGSLGLEMKGTIDGNVYRNDYFGLTCTLDDEWRFYSDEELLEQQGLAAESFEGTEMGENIEAFINSDSGFSVMMAEKDAGLENINLLVESTPGLGDALASEEELVSAVMEVMGTDDGDMSAMGLEGAKASQNKFMFAGEEHAGLRIDYVYNTDDFELPMYIQMIFLMKGDYVMQITLTTAFEDETEDLAELFTVDQ